MWSLISTVLRIQVYPKNNAPGVLKPQRVAKSDFLLILKIFLTLDDIRPGFETPGAFFNGILEFEAQWSRTFPFFSFCTYLNKRYH